MSLGRHASACMYVWLCMYVCTYVWMEDVGMKLYRYVGLSVCRYGCMYVCGRMYVCMDGCMDGRMHGWIE